MCELFFVLLFEALEKITMGTETIFASNRIFKNGSFKRSESERHVAAKENKEADAGEVGENVPHRIEADDGIESGLTENDSGIESGNI